MCMLGQFAQMSFELTEPNRTAVEPRGASTSFIRNPSLASNHTDCGLFTIVIGLSGLEPCSN